MGDVTPYGTIGNHTEYPVRGAEDNRGHWRSRTRMQSMGGVREIDTYDDFVCVDSIQDVLGEGDRIFEKEGDFTRLAPPKVRSGAPGLPLLKWTKNYPVPLRIVRIADALVFPGKRIINLGTGKLVLDSLRKPAKGDVRENDIPENDLEHLDYERIARILKSKNTPVLDGAFCAMSRHLGFGHFLLEAISQLWPLVSGLERDADERFLINAIPSNFQNAYFRALSIADESLVRVEKPVRVKGLLIASQSFIVQRGVAEPFFALAETIGNHYRADEAASSRVYISRRFATKRRMRNEEKIEALFAKNGFKIVHPEQLSVPEQIRLFAGAEWVAGSVGSGLYGSMFSPKNCRLRPAKRWPN